MYISIMFIPSIRLNCKSENYSTFLSKSMFLLMILNNKDLMVLFIVF